MNFMLVFVLGITTIIKITNSAHTHLHKIKHRHKEKKANDDDNIFVEIFDGPTTILESLEVTTDVNKNKRNDFLSLLKESSNTELRSYLSDDAAFDKNEIVDNFTKNSTTKILKIDNSNTQVGDKLTSKQVKDDARDKSSCSSETDYSTETSGNDENQVKTENRSKLSKELKSIERQYKHYATTDNKKTNEKNDDTDIYEDSNSSDSSGSQLIEADKSMSDNESNDSTYVKDNLKEVAKYDFKNQMNSTSEPTSLSKNGPKNISLNRMSSINVTATNRTNINIKKVNGANKHKKIHEEDTSSSSDSTYDTSSEKYDSFYESESSSAEELAFRVKEDDSQDDEAELRYDFEKPPKKKSGRYDN